MQVLKEAQDRAIEIITTATVGLKTTEQILQETKAMKKSELVDILMSPNLLQARINMLINQKREISIKDIAYDILCDPTCAWLSYDMIATLMQKYIPGCETSAKSLSWYTAKQHENNRDVCARKSMKEITRILINNDK